MTRRFFYNTLYSTHPKGGDGPLLVERAGVPLLAAAAVVVVVDGGLCCDGGGAVVVVLPL